MSLNLQPSKGKLLLVEDEALIAISQRKKLENIGYSVVTANTGEEALKFFAAEGDIALVLMDIDLGDGIDGTETAEKILQERKLPIVFFSSHSEKEIVRKTESIDSYGFIGKNSEITIIDASIKMALNLFNANKKARESEEYLNTIIDSTNDALVIGDARSFMIIDVNRSMREMFGYTADEAKQLDVRELDTEGIPFGDGIAEEWEKSVRTIGSRTFERLAKRKNGETFSAEISVRFALIRERECIVASIRDITERKNAEKKISSLFSAMTEMVVIQDLVFDENGKPVNYRIVECNDAFSKTTGIRKEDAVGKLATEVYETPIPPYFEEFSRVALTGEPYEYTTYFEPMDKHFSISVVSPKKHSFATITTDITGLRHIQNSLNAKNAELENYLYIASHDLRSPLVNIQGFSQRFKKQADNLRDLLIDVKVDTETQAGLDALFDQGIPNTLGFIHSNVTKMDTLISGLLRISRAGRALMNIVRIDTGKMLSTIISNFDFQLTEIHAAIDIGELPDCFGDETLLNQLFSNILSNAIKYRDVNRQLTIEISGHSDAKKAVYSIRDNGIGIEENNIEKIWSVFFRVRPDSAETGEGLGLSLVKRIAEKHQGKVWVESVFRKGSTFNIELPANIFSEQ